MSDISLFLIKNSKAQKIKPEPLALEKKIQKLCEQNLSEFFAITFLSSEYSTGKNHGGRIDTLGIDENNSPVIIEYKLSSSENVINQGLYYLDWLMDHKADFEMLCLDTFGKKVDVDWTNPRLICIANDFSKYDAYAIAQINRNINLIRYKCFEDGFMAFELASSTSIETKKVDSQNKTPATKGIEGLMISASESLMNIYEELDEYILALGDDIQKKELKYYHAYSRIRNFVCLEVHPKSNKIVLYLKVPPSQIEIKDSRIRDVSNMGHFGTGDTEVTVRQPEDIDLVRTLIKKSYELS